jgi:hypothetical protein
VVIYTYVYEGRGKLAQSPDIPHDLRPAGLAPLLPALRFGARVFVYTLVPDGRRPNVTWLQVLLIRQSTLCELKGKKTVTLPYQVFYPGEPKVLEVTVEVEILKQKTPSSGSVTNTK